eukprot:TRINITY_DN58221_c0_g1_i1.p1 TRINITY_DN58221_c0_g1~~TRINITY_DN58221_c0_g1_i1.p1  ORF type:complete len:406 (-),score=69.25 TRINITY_DN58221_c0_g1_i1:112-1329(-)
MIPRVVWAVASIPAAATMQPYLPLTMPFLRIAHLFVPFVLDACRGTAATTSIPDVDTASEVTILQQCLGKSLPRTRSDFPQLLNCLGLLQEAVEVGVQSCVHSSAFLSQWNGQRLRLVDTWGVKMQDAVDSTESQLFYVDIANNGEDRVMHRHRSLCEERLEAEFRSGKAQIVHQDSVAAAKQIPNKSLDFVYLDARHDFAGVVADVNAWWPKVRVGGIFAGHDFVDGEFPEGDFFWISALSAALPNVKSHVRVTEERDRYPSFFIVKTPTVATATTVRVAEPASVAKMFYAQRSRYFSLWRRVEARGFPVACAKLCEKDCSERVRKYTPTRSPGSTLRPFSCSGGSGVVRGEQGVGDVCAAEFVVDHVAYKEVCLQRCDVTCTQRASLFAAVGEQIVASTDVIA